MATFRILEHPATKHGEHLLMFVDFSNSHSSLYLCKKKIPVYYSFKGSSIFKQRESTLMCLNTNGPACYYGDCSVFSQIV